MVPRAYRFGLIPFVVVPAATLLGMFFYQWLKHFFTPEMTLWQSHINTNIFVTAIVSLAAFLLCKYLESSTLLTSIAAASDDAIIGCTLGGVVLAWNNGAAKMYGYSASEMIGKPLSTLVPPDRPDDVAQGLARVARGERVERHVTARIRKDGRIIHVSVTASPVSNAAGKVTGASVIVRDITERKIAEAALRESRERLAQAQAFSLTMVAHLGLDGCWLKVPARLCDLFGYSEDEMQDRKFEEITYPDDCEMERRLCGDLIRGTIKSIDLEKRCITKDGRLIWVYLNYSTVTDSAGDPVYFLAYIRDVTKRKMAEEGLKAYQTHLEELVESRTRALTETNEHLKKEILERGKAEQSVKESAEKFKFFAYSVIHDLKSPSVGIYGLTRLLNEKYHDILDERGRAYCGQILKATEHVAELIQEINDYIVAKEAPLTFRKVDTEGLFAEVREEFAERLRAEGVEWDGPQSACEIRADRTSILRALRNFVDNALKYGGCRLRKISLDCTETAGSHILSVTDDGGSLGAEDIGRIFDVFQRCESSNGTSGSGLGLAIVKEIAERHGGRVWVEPVAEGKTFFLSIPKQALS
ncbi:MAG: PAS domain S-box protein [Desulfobacteraceae bacterium]|nr:PAS domain S-box protein [Desulfobacteraceae bacterium]